ncbi:MAG: SPASM domain-containing protein, partial [Candidatus Zixiibacteriota bacterium]
GNSVSLTDLVKWLIKNDLQTRLSVVRGYFLPEEHELLQLIEDFDAMFSEIEKQEYDIDPRRLFTICELSFRNPRGAFSCGIGTSHLVVYHDGTVARCPMMVGKDKGRLNNNLLQSIRSQLCYDPINRYTTQCVSCKWFSVCVGGCPVTNEKDHGDPFALPSLHTFYAYVIPRFVRFFGIKLLQKVKARGLENCIIAKP